MASGSVFINKLEEITSNYPLNSQADLKNNYFGLIPLILNERLANGLHPLYEAALKSNILDTINSRLAHLSPYMDPTIPVSNHLSRQIETIKLINEFKSTFY